jgi:BASS family bile acid:Na+ symporter
LNSDRLINILAGVTLVELMLTIGLGATLADVLAVARDWRGVIRAALANYVLVPAAAVGLVLLFHAHPLVAAGVMVVAVCPGAPYAPPFTALAKGDVARAIGLMVILAGSSALLAPLLLRFLLPFVSRGGGPVNVDSGRIVSTLALIQFIPLCVGLGIAAYRPALARRLKGPAAKLSTVLNVLLLGTILAVQYPMLSTIRTTGYVGMFALLACSAAAGWLLGGPVAAHRTALSITTSVRNVGVGLVIAGGSFPGTPAVTFTTAYALFQTAVVALVVVVLARRTQAAPAAAAPSPAPPPPRDAHHTAATP